VLVFTVAVGTNVVCVSVKVDVPTDKKSLQNGAADEALSAEIAPQSGAAPFFLGKEWQALHDGGNGVVVGSVVVEGAVDTIGEQAFFQQ